MSADYWISSQRTQWQFTKEQLNSLRLKIILWEKQKIINNTLGIRYDTNMRIFIHQMLAKLGRRLMLRQIVISTAEVYISRFLTRVSLIEINIYMLITAAVYLAGKVCESPQHIRTVLAEARNCWPEFISGDFTKLAEFEFYLIEELNCFMVIYHPYNSLTQLIGVLGRENKANNDTMSESGNERRNSKYRLDLTDVEIENTWQIINDSYATDLPLLYPPHIVAIAALQMTLVLRLDSLEIEARGPTSSSKKIQKISNRPPNRVSPESKTDPSMKGFHSGVGGTGRAVGSNNLAGKGKSNAVTANETNKPSTFGSLGMSVPLDPLPRSMSDISTTSAVEAGGCDIAGNIDLADLDSSANVKDSLDDEGKAPTKANSSGKGKARAVDQDARLYSYSDPLLSFAFASNGGSLNSASPVKSTKGSNGLSGDALEKATKRSEGTNSSNATVTSNLKNTNKSVSSAPNDLPNHVLNPILSTHPHNSQLGLRRKLSHSFSHLNGNRIPPRSGAVGTSSSPDRTATPRTAAATKPFSRNARIVAFTNFLAGSNVNLEEVIDSIQQLLNLYESWQSYDEGNVRQNVKMLIMSMHNSGNQY